MKRGTKFIQTTMAKANEVQSRYNALGAPWTQNVRNPLPMPSLVLTVLPTLPLPTSLVDVTRKIKTTALGRSFLKTVHDRDYAQDVLGRDHWEKRALTVDEVMEKLQARGFIVRKGTVAMALNSGKYGHNVQAMRFTKPEGGRGSSYCRYFLAA